MWALRRAGSTLRTRAHQVIGVRGFVNLEVLLNADAKNVEGHHGCNCQKLDCCHQPKPSVFQSSFSSGWFMWSRGFSSQVGANSGDMEDEFNDGFSDLDVPTEADKNDPGLTSHESSDEDTIDAIGLPEVEADAKPEDLIKKASRSTLFKALLEAARNDVTRAVKKWLNDGNTLHKSDMFHAIRNLRSRKLFSKALQLLECIEESKLLDFGERDYASLIDLVAKVHGVRIAEKYIEDIPASHRCEVVYRTLLANYVVAANVRKAEEVFNKMKDLGFPITVFSCNQLLLLYTKVDKRKIGDVLAMMEKENLKPSLFTYNLLADMKGAVGDIEGMEKVIDKMQEDGIEPDLMTQATIAKHYIFGGHHEKAEKILVQMEGDGIKKNRVGCKFVLPLYAFLGKNAEAERIWKVCEANGAHSDECMSAIEAFGRLGDVEKAEEIFENMFKSQKKPSSKHYNAMLRAYARKNLFEKGKELAKRMSDDGCRIGPFTLDSLVKLHVDAGEVEKADSMLHELARSNKFKPLYSTYLTLLDSYSKKGDIHNAEKVFSNLQKMGYSRKIVHYRGLLQAYVNAKAPAYGFKERMKADGMFPNGALASLLSAADRFTKKNAISELLD
ncbi:hypothetical protein GUJ93_ZPchr0008g12149 [Zizania palustris]|uniref:PROP1-like PPR domain-containing protein n=1 Tax=Zizania palustris TaxID=103762 RepID=A0A8J5V3J3_ZIZPA|nr:hypothetical protein GUJ93_ZPchr0008g12149 [Zizania palustris]